MARSSATIWNSLVNGLVAAAAAVGIYIVPSNWSKTDIKGLILYAVALEEAFLEQEFDAFTSNIETQISMSAAATKAWIQDKMINLFEYNSISVPIVQLSPPPNLYPYYESPNPANNVIKYCSVQNAGFGGNVIKIAGQTAGVPSSLYGSPVVSAAQSFINIICASGITNTVIANNADQILIYATIQYNGLYAAVIQQNIINAINTYLQDITFNGSIELGDLLIAIKSVEGVISCIFNNVSVQPDTTSSPGATNFVMVSSNTWNQDTFNSVGGWIIPNSSTPLSSTLTLIAV